MNGKLIILLGFTINIVVGVVIYLTLYIFQTKNNLELLGKTLRNSYIIYSYKLDESTIKKWGLFNNSKHYYLVKENKLYDLINKRKYCDGLSYLLVDNTITGDIKEINKDILYNKFMDDYNYQNNFNGFYVYICKNKYIPISKFYYKIIE